MSDQEPIELEDPTAQPAEVELPPEPPVSQYPCPGHETDVGTLTHSVAPDGCVADGFEPLEQ